MESVQGNTKWFQSWVAKAPLSEPGLSSPRPPLPRVVGDLSPAHAHAWAHAALRLASGCPGVCWLDAQLATFWYRSVVPHVEDRSRGWKAGSPKYADFLAHCPAASWSQPNYFSGPCFSTGIRLSKKNHTARACNGQALGGAPPSSERGL